MLKIAFLTVFLCKYIANAMMYLPYAFNAPLLILSLISRDIVILPINEIFSNFTTFG